MGDRKVPTKRETGSKVNPAIYDVIAEDGHLLNFLGHTGLASRPGEQDRNAVAVSHMGPPISSLDSMRADVICNAELTEGEVRKIKAFIDQHEGEHRALRLCRSNISQAYCICPHAERYKADGDRYVRMRFNCSGFVFEAYKQAKIELLNIDKLPLATLDQIKEAFPQYARFLDHPEFRESMGLAGYGPWPVMFCGYIAHAANRTASEIRSISYLPNVADAAFPRIP